MECLSDESSASRMALPTLLVSSVTVSSPPEDRMLVMCAEENCDRSMSCFRVTEVYGDSMREFRFFASQAS